MPTYTDLAGTTENTLEIGKGDSGDKSIVLNNSDVDKPTIKFNDTSKAFELDNGDLECSRIKLTDNVSLTKGITFADGSRQYSAAGASPRILPDSDDILVFKLDESGRSETTFVNTGTLGTPNNLIFTRGSSTLYHGGGIGVYDKSLNVMSYQGVVDTDNVMFEVPKTGAEPTYPITVSLWFYHFGNSSTTNNNTLFYKSYRSFGTWTAPYSSVSLYVNESSGIRCPMCTVTTSGTRKMVDGRTIRLAQVNYLQWHHIGMTYDGAYLKLYFNGVLWDSLAVSGAIDYNSGSGGNWVLGSDGIQRDPPKAKIADIRVATTIRDASWFRNVYAGGYKQLHVRT